MLSNGYDLADIRNRSEDRRTHLAAWKSGREPSIVWWNGNEGYHSFTTGSFDRFDIPDQYAPDWFRLWAPIPAVPALKFAQRLCQAAPERARSIELPQVGEGFDRAHLRLARSSRACSARNVTLASIRASCVSTLLSRVTTSLAPVSSFVMRVSLRWTDRR
jgi:hypothetical protein